VGESLPCEIVLFVSFKGVSGSFIHYYITEFLLQLTVNFIFAEVGETHETIIIAGRFYVQ